MPDEVNYDPYAGQPSIPDNLGGAPYDPSQQESDGLAGGTDTHLIHQVAEQIAHDYQPSPQQDSADVSGEGGSVYQQMVHKAAEVTAPAPSWEECSVCGGTAQLICDACGGAGSDGMGNSCAKCQATGVIACETCQATGFVAAH